ncbi:MAG: DUF1194 domain-containing protein [Leptolyngbyaceae cyanobacterium]
MESPYLWSLAAATGLAVLGSLTSPSMAATLVSTELVLSVDVSGSIDDDEFQLQRSSYASVFRDQSVINLIESLDNGLAVTLQYWATQPEDTLPWYHVTNQQSAYAFANAIDSTSRPFEGFTNIAAALKSAREEIQHNQFVAPNQIIDISSDGRQNTRRDVPKKLSEKHLCAPREKGRGTVNDDLDEDCLIRVRDARDTAVEAGITVNGLPILTEFDDLDDYFVSNVIGGENAFFRAASDFSDFQQAIINKVKQEISTQVTQEAALNPPPSPAPEPPLPPPLPAPPTAPPPAPPISLPPEPTPPPVAPSPPAPTSPEPAPPPSTTPPVVVPSPVPSPTPAAPVSAPLPPPTTIDPVVPSVPSLEEPDKDPASVPEPNLLLALSWVGWHLRTRQRKSS